MRLRSFSFKGSDIVFKPAGVTFRGQWWHAYRKGSDMCLGGGPLVWLMHKVS